MLNRHDCRLALVNTRSAFLPARSVPKRSLFWHVFPWENVVVSRQKTGKPLHQVGSVLYLWVRKIGFCRPGEAAAGPITSGMENAPQFNWPDGRCATSSMLAVAALRFLTAVGERE